MLAWVLPAKTWPSKHFNLQDNRTQMENSFYSSKEEYGWIDNLASLGNF
jgi:hypothetical protein